ncbi:MAG: hypothetical protein ABIR04_10120, partial [Cypionkella sp.]
MQDDVRPDQIAPINPLPGVVWLLALPMIGLEILFSLADQRGFAAISRQEPAVRFDVGLHPECRIWRC